MKKNQTVAVFLAKAATTLFIVGFIIIALLMMGSCQSHSSKLLEEHPLEKVAILSIKYDHGSDRTDGQAACTYRVKRLEHGVVTTIRAKTDDFVVGDTIYHRFIH